jgi:lipopolysaccharide export system protein LptA
MTVRRKSPIWSCAVTVVLLGVLGIGASAISAQDSSPAVSVTAEKTPAADTSPPSGEVTIQSDAASTPGAAAATASPAASTANTPVASASPAKAGASAQSKNHKQGSTKGAAKADANEPASPFAALSSPNSGPINIKSDSLSVDYKKNSAMWRGHVHAIRADGQLDSDTLQVLYGKDFHELQQMIASGNVRISRGTQWSTSDHAVLNEASQTVVLTGNPVVHDSNDQITGSKITVYLKTGESVVEGAKAVIFPRQGKTRDNGPSADHAN